jgi:Fe-S-cluster containining protein
MNREERRRAQAEAVRAYHEHGLPPSFDFSAMFVHTRMLMRVLGKAPDRARLLKATQAYHAGFERSLQSHPSPRPVACQAGCSLCCHNWISVTIPEVLLIAEALQARFDAALPERIAEAAGAGMNLDRDQRLERRLACPLLVDHLCSIYGVRPLACRSFFSLSLAACQAVFDGTDEDVPTPRDAMVLRGVHDRCFWAALRASGLGHEAVELNHALHIALAHDDACAAWLGASDPFTATTRDVPHDAEELLFLDVLIAGARVRKLPENPWVT